MPNIQTGALEKIHIECISSFYNTGKIPYTLQVRLHDAVGEVAMKSHQAGLSFQYIFDNLLFMACAEGSYDKWESLNPDGALHFYKDYILKIIQEKSNVSEVLTYFVEADQNVMQKYYDRSQEFQNTAGLAGLSCVRALSVCVGEFSFDRNNEAEIEIYPYDWDSAFLSSCAIAGGAEWQIDDGVPIDEVARTEFWRWFVDEAVPSNHDKALLLCR